MLNQCVLKSVRRSGRLKHLISKAPLALLALVLLSSLSCGKRKPPVPPKERVSQRVELSGYQRGDQVIHAHVTIWTDDAPVAADTTTLLAQQVVAPWASQLALDPDTGQAATVAADDRDADLLAAAILGAPTAAPEAIACDDEPGLLALARLIGRGEPGPRERGWAGSPVPSNRFT